MPRKRIGPVKNYQRKWTVTAQRSKYSPRTEDEFFRFMYGYLGSKKEFLKFKRAYKNKKKQTEKSE